MVRPPARPGPRLRGRRGRRRRRSARSVPRLAARRQLRPLGMLQYTPGPDGVPQPDEDTALGVFTDPTCSGRFPGPDGAGASAHQAGRDDERIIDIDYCNNAHGDPSPRTDRRHRRPRVGAGRQARRARRCSSAASPRARLTPKPQDMPLLREKLAWLLENQRRRQPNSHAYRETRALFNRFPSRELFYADADALKGLIERIVYMSGDDEIAVTTRQGAGYHAVLDRVLRPALFAQGGRGPQAGARRGVRPDLLQHAGPTAARSRCCCSTSTPRRSSIRSTSSAVEGRSRAARSRPGRTGSRSMLEQAFGPLEGRRLFRRYIRTETRSGLYRESTPPEEVPEDSCGFEQLEAPPRGRRPAGHRRNRPR